MNEFSDDASEIRHIREWQKEDRAALRKMEDRLGKVEIGLAIVSHDVRFWGKILTALIVSALIVVLVKR